MESIEKGEAKFSPWPLTTADQLKQSRQKREERSDAVQNRQRILEIARTLFAENGVENVTMTEIAEKACLGKGTLYRHFAHKGELCLALLEQTSREFQNGVLAEFGAESHRSSALGRLRLYFDRSLEFIDKNYALLKPATEAAVEHGDLRQGMAYLSIRRLVEVLLKEAVASGECRADLDVDFMADALQAPLEVNLFLYQRQVLGFSVARIQAGMRQLIEGIMAKS